MLTLLQVSIALVASLLAGFLAYRLGSALY
jgi:photosystem I reaction center subunit XII